MKKTKFSKTLKKQRNKIIFSFVALVCLILAAIGFKFLVKVGSPKYIYNYMNDTKGSLASVVHQEAANFSNLDKPAPVEETTPSAFGLVESIQVDGVEVNKYKRKDKIFFSEETLKSGNTLEGISTFRGDYLRNNPSYGMTLLNDKKFDLNYWTFGTGKVLKSNGVDYWSGNGWTGQPMVVKWDEDTKSIMNLYPEAATKQDLIEVIYPGMDGWIHFLDMETGKETRPPINVGMTFKGTASIYPNGIPLLFCGSGDAQTGVYGENISPRFYIYSLIDGSLLYEYGANDAFAPRIWHAYDSSPIIHAETDTLIYPGENGVLYTMKLNTEYDLVKGTIEVNPSDFVSFSYTSDRYSEGKVLWGSECSAVVWENYLFIGDNGGIFYCLDLNKMQMVWAQDLKEDINSTPILEIDEMGNKFIYVGTTAKYNLDEHSMGEAGIYKLNAMTGQIIWTKPYEVHYVKGLAGGVLSTGIVGKGPIQDYVLYSVSKTPGLESGFLVALDKKTGAEVWSVKLENYSWSSGVVVYPPDGGAYLIQGCQNGDLLLLNAETGEILDKLNFASGIEATPAIFGNRIVFGVRSEKIIGVSLK